MVFDGFCKDFPSHQSFFCLLESKAVIFFNMKANRKKSKFVSLNGEILGKVVGGNVEAKANSMTSTGRDTDHACGSKCGNTAGLLMTEL